MMLAAGAFSAPARAGVTADSMPEVFCEFSSRQAPVDRAGVRMFVDGRDVSAEAEVLQWKVSWRPAEPLSPGVHNVRVVVADLNGGRGEKKWSFTIDPEAAGKKEQVETGKYPPHGEKTGTAPADSSPGLGAPPARGKTHFFLDAVPSSTVRPCIAATGRAAPGAAVSLVLNGAPVLFETADTTGVFSFRNVCLAPGRNVLLAETPGADGLPAETTPEKTVFFEDSAPPAAAPADEPAPEIPAPDILEPESPAPDSSSPPEPDTPVIPPEPEPSETIEPEPPAPDTPVLPEPETPQIAGDDEPAEPETPVIPPDRKSTRLNSSHT